jgi:hypothetical protein
LRDIAAKKMLKRHKRFEKAFRENFGSMEGAFCMLFAAICKLFAAILI